ncbi:MAG: L-2-hydroxyglutarate oxidase [Amaricoccus sp.]|nr:L-2-hydroxyglutarate oxidase [Amaricoccus sp.]
MYDFCVIGGGIVGLAAARALLARRPGASLVLLEKEDALGRHQTGRNSGVIHSGVYYAPGSLKARLCREGSERTVAFCAEKGVPFERRGKLIVATRAEELPRLDELERRAAANGVAAERLDAGGVREREPAVTGIAALAIPAAAIVSYRAILEALAADLRAAGAELRLGVAPEAIREGAEAVEVATAGGAIRARRLVACAGLQSDRVARMAGLPVAHRIVPFRGEYFRLAPRLSGVVRAMIYPVPDPALPFLGIHLTPMIDGSVTVGPNAVLGLAREGYAKGSVSARDVADMAGFPGFWRCIGANLRPGLAELGDTLFRGRYLAACRRYCPELGLGDLLPMEAGIRAQAVLADGTLAQDFLFLDTPRSLHVCNAPSPAATSALPIGEMIAERLMGGEGA